MVSDPTVKQLILKLDEQENHSIVLEDLDQYRILVVEPKVAILRQELEKLLEENTYAAGEFLSCRRPALANILAAAL